MTTAVSAKQAAEAVRALVEAYTDTMTNVEEPKHDGPDWKSLYTESPMYLEHLGVFHRQTNVIEFIQWLLDTIPQHEKIWDVGCVCGYTGMAFALNGYDVAFHDFDGLGLDFLRWMKDENVLGYQNITIVPYGEPAPRRDWAIALDVIEHTTNQLAFLRWMSDLGRRVAFTFPTSPYKEPFRLPLDQWVDGEAVGWIVERRHNVIHNEIADGRTYIVFE